MLLPRTRRLALAALLLAPSAAAAVPAPKQSSHGVGRGHGSTAKLEPPARRVSIGRSIGSPTEGHLIGGAHLNESPYVRIVPAYAAGDARWGLEPLVGLIDHAARAVRKQYSDAVLSVGHLSRSGGGEIDRHASHESGRDADIGFYVKNQQGKSIYADHFVAFKGDGTASTWPGAQFDDSKNWAFIAAIAGDAQARVTHIFVASPLRTRLLQYAEKIGAPHAIRVRASELMAQPRGALPHDDHFHVRIGCPAGMDKCIEQPLARKQPRTGNKAALASAHRGAPAPHGKPHTPASRLPGQGALSPKPSAPAREAEEAESKNEPLVPSLAPIVPGLDSAVIAAPLGGVRAPKTETTPPAADAQPIDDPDGVLEKP
ncbi:MAG TPA: penicillin-insensitive murein endopeptidase [Labilithrix sp.]|nr:penicillin-insensitive murein endopeptidase [Labilithrix sp.]